MSKETTPTPEHPTDEELCGFMELTPQWWTRLKNAARDRNRLERRLEALESAALAVTQAASRTVARGMMMVPDFQIDKLRAALGGDRDE